MNFVDNVKKGQRYLYVHGNYSILLEILEDKHIPPGSTILVECKVIQQSGFPWIVTTDKRPFSKWYFEHAYTYLEGQDAP